MLCITAYAAKGLDEVHKVKFPGGRSYMFRVKLADKKGTPFNLNNPRKYLSEKAIMRRQKQRLGIDSTDLPINPIYIDSVTHIGGEVVSRSRWHNTLLVRVKRMDTIHRIAKLSCVRSTRLVWSAPDSIDAISRRVRFHSEFNSWDTIDQTEYGVAEEQIDMLSGDRDRKSVV